MSFEVQLEKFSGPLNLLLDLIEQEKLDISQVALATVTEAYLRHLAAHPEIPPEEMADFLLVASKLLLIKSRLLLPFLQTGEEESLDDLETQLKIYKEYLEASKVITDLIGRRRFLYVHDKLPSVEIGFAPPKKLTTNQMSEMFRALLKRLDVVVKVPSAVIERTVSIHEKIRHLQALVERASRLSFRSVLESAESRIEVVVSFLALLELIKQRSVSVSQTGQFNDITIVRVEESRA